MFFLFPSMRYICLTCTPIAIYSTNIQPKIQSEIIGPEKMGDAVKIWLKFLSDHFTRGQLRSALDRTLWIKGPKCKIHRFHCQHNVSIYKTANQMLPIDDISMLHVLLAKKCDLYFKTEKLSKMKMYFKWRGRLKSVVNVTTHIWNLKSSP